MIKLISFILFLLLPGLKFPVNSQSLKFHHLTNKEGLSQSTVNCILQDKSGFIWIGTQEGLNRYNGYEFLIFLNNPYDSTSISGNYITALYEDSGGNIWIGTNGGGLNLFRKNKGDFTRFSYSENDPGSISDNRIRTIAEDREKKLWIGTDNGLNAMKSADGRSVHFTRYSAGNDSLSLKSSFISTLLSASSGNFYIGTNGSGIFIFNRRNGLFSSFSDPAATGKILPPGILNIRCITEDKENNLWIGTEGGICMVNQGTGRWNYFHSKSGLLGKTINNNKVLSVKQVSNGEVWIGTFGGGINIWDPVTGKFTYSLSGEEDLYSLGDNYIRVIYEDKVSSVWIGTNHAGVDLYHTVTSKFRHIRKVDNNASGLSGNTVFALLESGDTELWIGTSEGLSIFTPVTGQFRQFDTLSSKAHNNAVLSLLQSRDTTIWVGTYGGGMSSFDKKTSEIRFFTPGRQNSISGGTVTDLLEDREGLIWIGTYGDGLNSYDRKKNSFSFFDGTRGLSSKNIYCLFEDTKGKIWVGTENDGFYIYNKQMGTFTHIFKGSSVQEPVSNTVNCIHEDEGGIFWFGTSAGLTRFDPITKNFNFYYEKDGLPGDYIYGILGDEEGNLWMSTNHGISKMIFIDREKNSVMFKNFDTDDGLQHNEFNQGAFFRGKKGMIYFGGINGFNMYDPKAIRDNPFVPPVFITSFKKFGKEEKTDRSTDCLKYVELSYRDKFFSFEFVALNYIFPHKNQYSYKLEGFDEDWTPASAMRYAGFTNIRGGDYIFRVRASNNDGVWNEEGARIHIHIKPPFWETKWFYSVAVIALLFLVYGFTRFRTYSIEKEKRALEEKVEERTKELAQKNNDIMSSIEYAEKIQDAMLPSIQMFKKHFPDSFIFYRPRDIVSGDFYWIAQPPQPPEGGIIQHTDDVYGYQTADPFLYGQLKDFVKEHRSVPTEAEKIFWELIRGKRLDGYKFRRQHIIGYYIADFVCLQEKLVVEIDGLIHELPENKTSDEERTRYLNKKGFSVIRFTNNEIIGNPDGVIEKVLYHLKLCSSRNPPSGGRGAVLLSIADCTGHGVPGAFMSMIGHNLLNTLVIKNRITDPGEVLTQLNREILTALKQESGSDSQDGMDITLCAIIPDPYPDKQDIRAEVLFAGANNPLFVARNSFLQGIPAPAHGVNAAPEISLQVIDGDDFPVGGTQFNPDRTFKTHKILLGNNECIYLTTDGYIDQFGGTGRKKFMTRRFLKLLREAGGFTMEEQEKIIITEHEKWKGSDQQVDDILVAGIRF